MLIPCVIDAGKKKTTCLVDGEKTLKVELDNEEYGVGGYTGAVIALAAGLVGGDKEKALGILAAAALALGENIKSLKGATKVHPKRREKKSKPVMQRVGEENAGKCVFVNAENTVYGILGTPTNYVDSKGKKLFVGDLVTATLADGSGFGYSDELLPVVGNVKACKPYVYDLVWLCFPETGKFNENTKITRVKNWYELCVGERLRDCGLTVRWRDAE